MRKLQVGGFLALMIACVAPPASAQPELSVGYQYLRAVIPGRYGELPFGWGVDYALPLTSGLRAVGSVDWGRRREALRSTGSSVALELTQLTVAGGVRYEVDLIAWPGARAYVQALGGSARSAGTGVIDGATVLTAVTHAPLFQPGFGFFSPVSRRAGIVTEVDYRRLWGDPFDSIVNEDVNGVRVFIGVRTRLP